jgi:MFS family permease
VSVQAIPRGVWVLGFVSLFMDVSSEMIHALLPLFVVGALGASAAVLGVIEGIAEATAQFARLFSGVLSDRWRNRKRLALLGYGLAAAVKPLFPLAATPFEVFVARFADRIGKGIRGAPRDALVADLTPPLLRGAAYGLRQSLDTAGAFLGPLLAIALMAFLADDLRSVLWVAVIPAAIAVAILAIGIREPEHHAESTAESGFNPATARALGRAFWIVAGFGSAMMLARFSEAFLVLKAAEAGLAARYVPAVLVVMSAVYALASYPAGILSDRLGRRGLLAAGIAVLIVADLALAAASGIAAVMAGVALWGLHMGLTQGLLATLVADTTPRHLRGTAFGVFNLASGAALCASSILAGVLWDGFGSSVTFMAGAGFAAAVLLGIALLAPGRRR